MSIDVSHDLGTFEAEYIPRRKPGCLILGLLAGILLGLLVLGVGIFLIVGAFAWYRGADRFFFVAFGLMVGLLGVWLAIRAIRKRNLGKRVGVYAEGMAYTQQGKTHIIGWDDISSVWQDTTARYFRQPWQTQHRYAGTTHRYTLQLGDGSRFTFDDALANVGELGRVVQQETLHRLLPRLLEGYEAGETLSFGKLSLSKDGISKGYMTMPWEQVKNVEIYEGFLNIYSQKEPSIGKLILSKGKGDWASLPVAKIPNVLVFKAAVDQILASSR